MSIKDNIIITVANLLGVRMFKKYWPVEGRIWNDTHIDKNSRDDLDRVIRNSYEYTKYHINGAITTLVMALPLIALDNWEKSIVMIKFVSGVMLIHGYAFMVHEYNRILARRALSQLPNEITKDNKWKTLKVSLGYIVTYGHVSIGPVFVKETNANSFMKYLSIRYDGNIQQLHNDKFKDNLVSMYNEYLTLIE